MTILKAEEFMPEITEIQEIMSHFGLSVQYITAFHDTSRGDDDRRLNYVLDNKYVLKINSSSVMNEQRLREIHRLIKRYHSIGVYMPEISGPTIPLSLLPKLGYKAVPLGKNWSYGIAALIFAATEYKKLCDQRSN